MITLITSNVFGVIAGAIGVIASFGLLAYQYIRHITHVETVENGHT